MKAVANFLESPLFGLLLVAGGSWLVGQGRVTGGVFMMGLLVVWMFTWLQMAFRTMMRDLHMDGEVVMELIRRWGSLRGRGDD